MGQFLLLDDVVWHLLYPTDSNWPWEMKNGRHNYSLLSERKHPRSERKQMFVKTPGLYLTLLTDQQLQ